MVEELKLAIKIDDASIEQSLLKQFANAQKMADKVVLDFRNVNFDDKQIEAKFKEMQKKAGQNPIDLTISDNALDMLGQIDKRLTEIFSIGKGKSFIDSSSITADIRKIENKINELNKKINTSFDTKNKTEAYNQLKKYADAFKDYYNNEEAMASESGTKAAYAYYKAYEEALKKEVAQSKLEKVTVDFDINDKFLDKNRIVSDRIKEYANYKKYGNDNNLLEEISSLKNKLFDFNSAYSQVKEKLGQAAITPEIIKSVERYVELLDKARFLEQLNDPDDNDTIKSHRAMAQVSLDDALFNAQEQSNKYTESLRQQEEQITSTVEAEQKLAEVQKETTSNSVTSDNSQIEELKSDIQEVKTELGDVKDRISSIESNGFENVREDVEKTKESVKELNGELTEMKSNISSTPQESNISSRDSSATSAVEQQKKDTSDIIKLTDNYGRELDEANSKLLKGTALLDEQGKLIRLYHGSDTEFNKFDLSRSNNQNNQIYGKGAYLIESEKGAEGYGSVVTQWYANVRKVMNEEGQLTLEEAQKLYNEFGKRLLNIFGKQMDFNEFFDAYIKFNPEETTVVEKMKSLANHLGKDIGDLFQTIGYDAIKMDRSNGSFYTIFDPDRLIRFKEAAVETTSAVEKLGASASQNPTKDAFPSTEATASVEKTTQAIREENNALDETVSKAKQAASELTKTRDIVSQNWYREKGTVVGKDSKGNDITRDADEFSFVERLKNGQLQTVLATYDEETGKWAEQVINVRTAFEQVEKAIISADNKIASLEMAKERTLASHPGYDATADDNQIAIERKKRDELQATLNLYGSEKEYVFEIEAATKRIADNQKRLNNKKQSQTNLRQAVSDEKDAKANEQANKRDAKQAQIEAENIKLAEQKSIYNELIDSIDRYSTVSKRIESGKAFEGDYEEAARLQEKIEELQNNPILSQEQLDASQRKLEKIETTLEDIATAKAKSDSIKVDSENVKNIQAEWDKNIKAIQDYMDAMTKLNNLKAKDKGTGSEANQIALQTQNVEELKQAAWDARKNLSSIQAENPDIIAWKQWVDMMELFDQASKGSAESAAKLKDVLDNIKAPSLDKYENKLASYQTKKGAYNATIARFNDGGWTSDEYLKNVQAVKDAVNEYETLLNELKGKDASLVTSDDISKLDEYEKKIKDAIATVTNMSAAEKGYNFVSGQKELDKIHKLLNENSKMSSEAKAKIKAYYTEIESGNPSMSLDRIHGEIMKIYNAEVEAGRAGRSFFDTLKNSGFHQLAAQMSGMFGFYDVINIGKQAISTIVSLDDALVDLKKTTAMNKTQLEQYYYDANDVAKQMGVTTEEIINQSSAWSRLGYNTAEASTEMAKLSSQFASISPGMGVDEAQSGLVSIMKAWSIDPDQVKSEIMDPINQLGNTMAEDNQDIVEGMERSAAALAAVGTSTKDAFALFSGIQEVLQNAEKSGTSLKSVALRLRSFDETTGEYSEDLANITGELIDLTKTAEHAEGVSIFKPGSTTEFKDLTDYFREIAGIWDEMTQKQQNDFLIKAFGRNQAQAGAALIQNFKAVDKALAEMGESAGSSDKEMEAVESSLSYKINALKETWVGCVQDMIDRGDLGTIVTGLTKVSEAITFLLDKLGILGSIGLGAGIFSGIKNVGGNKMHFPMNILDNIHNLLWIQRFRVCYP